MKEFVKCNLCNKDDTRLVFKLWEYNIVKCKNCGLVYVNPRLKEKALHKIYNKDYYQNKEFKNSKTQKLFGYNLYIQDKEDIVNTFKRRLEIIEKYKKGKKLLDVGCATGFFLGLARSRGWKVYGTDVSKFACDYARKELSVKNIFHGDLKDAKFKDGMFDVVLIFDVIEHLPKPKKVLKEINRILKKGGIIAVTTPDIGSPMAKLLGKRWEEVRRVREHIYFFSEQTLTKMLQTTGFKVLESERAGRYFSLRSAVKRGKLYSKSIFTLLEKAINLLGIQEKKVYINPHYKVTLYAKKIR